jgi:hypothetical protein
MPSPAGRSVAVSAVHKRQGIAKALTTHYLKNYRAAARHSRSCTHSGSTSAAHLGLGYGTPTYRYRFAAETLRDDGALGTVRMLGPNDIDALHAMSACA